MIRFLLMMNKQGTPRISQYYDTELDGSQRRKVESDVYRTIITRGSSSSNFCEQADLSFVYRRYVGLYVVVGIEPGDSEMLALETIHLFVEILDRYFGTVRELDIVYHFNAVYAILDEFILAGQVQETNKDVILQRIKRMPQLSAK